MPLKHSQSWNIHQLSGKPVPEFDHPPTKEIFPGPINYSCPISDGHRHLMADTGEIPSSTPNFLISKMETSILLPNSYLKHM